MKYQTEVVVILNFCFILAFIGVLMNDPHIFYFSVLSSLGVVYTAMHLEGRLVE